MRLPLGWSQRRVNPIYYKPDQFYRIYQTVRLSARSMTGPNTSATIVIARRRLVVGWIPPSGSLSMQRILALLRTDRMLPAEAIDRTDPADAIDRTEPVEAIDPTEPADATDQTLRVEANDRVLQLERIAWSDDADNTEKADLVLSITMTT